MNDEPLPIFDGVVFCDVKSGQISHDCLLREGGEEFDPNVRSPQDIETALVEDHSSLALPLSGHGHSTVVPHEGQVAGDDDLLQLKKISLYFVKYVVESEL